MLAVHNNEYFHPFGYYREGIVQSYGENHYLRIEPHVLWVVEDKEPYKGKCRVYNGSSVNESEMGHDEIKKFKKYLELGKTLQAENEEKLETIRKPLMGAQSVDFESQKAATVLQREYSVAEATSIRPILGTYGAGPCVIMALYDSQNKKAILAHIDPSTNIDSLGKILGLLSIKHTSAHLYGGNFMSTSINVCLELVEFLEEADVKIVNSDIIRRASTLASLAIDSRNGRIYSPVESWQLSETSEARIKSCELFVVLQIGKTPLREFKAIASSKLILEQDIMKENKKNTVESNLLLKSLSKTGRKKFPYTELILEPLAPQAPIPSIMSRLISEEALLRQLEALLRQLEDKHIEEHRYDDPKLQREYDKRHGVILYKGASSIPSVALLIGHSILCRSLEKSSKRSVGNSSIDPNNLGSQQR